MKTIFSLIGLLFTFCVSTISFGVFILVEWFCVDHLTLRMSEMGVSESWINFVWLFMVLVIVIELLVFVVNFVWRKVVGKFKEMFSLS